MTQQKLSLFQSLNSSPSRAVGMGEVVRYIHYDNDVKQKTESYRQMASVLGKAKADEEVKRRLVPACSVGVLFDGNGRGAANVLGFTGLALVDIDHVVSEELRVKSEESQDRRPEGESQFATAINAIRQKIIDDPHTLLCYVTIGGNGFRILYRYQRAAYNTGEDNAAANWLSPSGRRSCDSSLFTLHSSLLGWALHKWLVAMVATWMSDFSTNHEIFVLIGRQGIYKTTFFRHLLPPQLRMYFWENAHNSFSSKDDHLALAENCLVEIEEIDLQNPRDISELKALATSEKVKERRPYARFREEKHRLASFCGSGNQQRFLSDDTGNRRWLCFMVDHIDDPRTWNLDYDQLYAQLRDELRQGFRYWFDPQEQRIVERQNQQFRIESDEEQLIRSRLRPPHPGDKITLMNAASVCQYINGGVVGRGLSTRKVGIIMQRLGFEKVHTMQGNFFKVFQIPADQIQSTLAMTDDIEENGNGSAPTFEEAKLPF